MNDGVEKLTTTLAETIDTISKSFSEHAPEVWESAVAYQKSIAVIDISYNVIYIIAILALYLFIIYKISQFKKLNKIIMENKDNNFDSREIMDAEIILFWSTIITSVFLVINIACTSSNIKRYFNSEYYAAIELINVVK